MNGRDGIIDGRHKKRKSREEKHILREPVESLSGVSAACALLLFHAVDVKRLELEL